MGLELKDENDKLSLADKLKKSRIPWEFGIVGVIIYIVKRSLYSFGDFGSFIFVIGAIVAFVIYLSRSSYKDEEG